MVKCLNIALTSNVDLFLIKQELYFQFLRLVCARRRIPGRLRFNFLFLYTSVFSAGLTPLSTASLICQGMPNTGATDVAHGPPIKYKL